MQIAWNCSRAVEKGRYGRGGTTGFLGGRGVLGAGRGKTWLKTCLCYVISSERRRRRPCCCCCCRRWRAAGLRFSNCLFGSFPGRIRWSSQPVMAQMFTAEQRGEGYTVTTVSAAATRRHLSVSPRASHGTGAYPECLNGLSCHSKEKSLFIEGRATGWHVHPWNQGALI